MSKIFIVSEFAEEDEYGYELTTDASPKAFATLKKAQSYVLSKVEAEKIGKNEFQLAPQYWTIKIDPACETYTAWVMIWRITEAVIG